MIYENLWVFEKNISVEKNKDCDGILEIFVRWILTYGIIMLKHQGLLSVKVKELWVTARYRLVRTRMLGGVWAGGEKPPATRLAIIF